MTIAKLLTPSLKENEVRVVDGIAKIGDTVYIVEHDDGGKLEYIHRATVVRDPHSPRIIVYDEDDRITTVCDMGWEVYIGLEKEYKIRKMEERLTKQQ
jgi:hypothetical protein